MAYLKSANSLARSRLRLLVIAVFFTVGCGTLKQCAYEGLNRDQNAGIAIVRRALQAPIRQIAENAGVDGAVVVGRVLENASATFGFNAQTEEYVDMVKAGVIDPAKVVRTALQDAASVAGLMITTEAAIVEAPKKGGGGAGGMPGGGMGGMGDMDF